MKKLSPRTTPLKAVTFFLTIGSLVGITAMPATAGGQEDIPVSVEVVDNSCQSAVEPALWNPDPQVTYGQDGNQVELDTVDSGGYVDFELNLGFSPGWDDCEQEPVAVTGYIDVSFIPDAGSPLELFNISCAGLVSFETCDAGVNYQTGSSMLYGTLDVTSVTEEGSYSGTLRVVWTP
jgi:hypothetical protein